MARVDTAWGRWREPSYPRVGGPGGRKAGEEEWGREGRVLLVALGELFPKKFSGWGEAGDLISAVLAARRDGGLRFFFNSAFPSFMCSRVCLACTSKVCVFLHPPNLFFASPLLYPNTRPRRPRPSPPVHATGILVALARVVVGRSALLVVIAPSGLSRKMAVGERSYSVALPALS